jgi:Flp pilus assembly protein TadD
VGYPKLEKRDGQAGVYWVSGIVELAEGDFARSIDNLRRAKDANEPGGYPAADQLATALERAGRIDEAVDTLRGCQTKLASQPDSTPYGGPTWMAGGTSHDCTTKWGIS